MLVALCLNKVHKVFHKAAIQNVYNVYYFKTSSLCIFNAIKKQSGIAFIVDALFGNFAYLHNLYIAVRRTAYKLDIDTSESQPKSKFV